jgi:uncharacterized protein YukE
MHEPRLEDLSSTDWSRLTVGQMWEVLGEVDQGPAVEQAAGWVNAFELLDQHRSRLQEYRDLIAQTWRGATADAFLLEVDELMAAVTTMRDAAIANEAVLPHLTASMAEAREQLAPIHQQWTASQSAVPTRSDPGPVAVSSGAQDQLHRQAIGVMTTLSGRVIEGYRAVQIPPAYDQKNTYLPQQPSNAAQPPGQQRGANSGAPLGRVQFRPGSAPPPFPAEEPTLAGRLSASADPRSDHGAQTPVISTIAGPEPLVGRIIGTVPRLPGSGISDLAPNLRPPAESGPDRPPGRILPPGGVINGPVDEHGPARPSPGLRRANPVGGVIGPTTGRETEGMFGAPVGGAVGMSGGQRQRARSSTFATDGHWPKPTGVPPVITSSAKEPIHDPGPVIGLPRERR